MIELAQIFLIEPLSFEFMQRAMVISLLIGMACAIFSCFLVLKGWSLMGDAVSHAILPGLALAVIFGIPLMLGAFLAGIFCAISIGAIKSKTRVKEDAVMGIIFSGMFALGLVMLTKIETDLHLMHILFGNVLGVSKNDVFSILIVAILATCIMIAKRRDLMLYCFDPIQSNIVGIPKNILHYGLLILLSLTIVAALNAAGIILVIAMLIAPGATAFLLSASFDRMLLIAIGTSLASCFTGVLLSFHLDTATAPFIVLIQACFFLIAFFVTALKSQIRYSS